MAHTVDVLVADLATVDIDEDLLAAPELVRALGIASTPHLRQYLAVHTWLRRRLSEHLSYPADKIKFSSGQYGKPVIVEPTTGVSFNLAYAGGRALLAIGYRNAVGVDVVSLEGARINPSMIHRVLADDETDWVLSADDQVDAFFRLLVRKEAFSKATGQGIEDDLPSIRVLGPSPVAMDGFVVHDLDVGDGFAAAAAVPPGSWLSLSPALELAADL